MAAKGNGTSTYLDTFPSTISPLTTAYSWAFWYNPSAPAANTTPNRHAFALINTGGGSPQGYEVSFIWQHTSSTVWKSAAHREAGGSFQFLQIPFTPASGVWIHLAATYDGVTLKLYYNGVLANSVAAANPSATAGNPNIGVQAWNNGAADFDNSPISELAIWSVALSADDVLALSRGTPVSSTQFGSVVWYNPLSSVTSTVGPNLTNHGATFNTTYFQSSDGGAAFGGDGTTTFTHYNWTPTGGFAAGGDGTLSRAIYHFTMDGGFAAGGDGTSQSTVYRWIMDGGFAAGGDGTTSGSHYHFTMDGGFAVGGKKGFPVVQPVGSGAVIVDTGREPAQTTK